MNDSEEWLREHKGDHIKTVGYVWECYDECGCTQARVVDYFRNKTVYSARVPVGVWEGGFYAEYRRHLRAENPAREATIEWQRGVDYSAHA